jgi:hypothetical protein
MGWRKKYDPITHFLNYSKTQYSSISPFHLPPACPPGAKRRGENEEEGGYSNCEHCSLSSSFTAFLREELIAMCSTRAGIPP